jgi:hypothetical protein
LQTLRSPRFLVVAILGVSLALRVALAWQGGQYFFGDEERYDRGVHLYQALAGGDFTAARAIAAQPEHALFPWLGALVTAGQHLLAQLTPRGDWSHPENISLTLGFGAALLSLFSALNLWLTHRLVRAAGASETEARWALLAMAASNTAFYYARHLLPYDCALAAALGALCLGLRAPSAARAFGCGALAGVAYGLYNGYWFLVPAIWVTHAWHWRGEAQRLRLAVQCAAGALAALATPVALGTALGGASYWTTMRAFSGTVTQGLFAEGWSLPWEFFWHAEGVAGVVIAAVIMLAWLQARRGHPSLSPAVTACLVALGASYALLVLFSNGLHFFVVYARTVKPFVPFGCGLAGWAVAQLLASRPRLQPVVAAGFVFVAVCNFEPHFARVFPREVEIAVLRQWGNPKRALSVSGSIYVPLALPVARRDLALVNAQLLYPVREFIGAPAGRGLLRVSHPLSYAPFQYEGHAPRERALLREHDIAMQLIQLADPAAVPDDPPPALRYRNEDRPTGR